MLPDLSKLEQQYGLPAGLLNAVMQAESSGNPKAVSEKGAQGLFQFMPETAKAYGIDPLDPAQAADGAARMYADLYKQHGGDIDKMLMGYNWGSGNLSKYGSEKAPKETVDYIARVKASMPQEKQYADSGSIMNDSSGGLSLEQQQAIAIAEAEAQMEAEQPKDMELGQEDAVLSPEKQKRAMMRQTADTGIINTLATQYPQSLPFIGGFMDEAQALLGKGFAYPMLAYHNYMPEMLDGGAPGTELSVSDLPSLSDAMAMGNERVAAQLEERPGLSLGTQLAGGLLTAGPFLKSLTLGTSAVPAANVASKGIGNVAKFSSKVNDWAGRGNAITRAGKSMLTNVPAGYLYGLGDDTGEGRTANAEKSALYTAGLSAALPAVGATYHGGKKLAAGASQLLAPKIEQNVAELAQTAMEKYGIPLTRSQVGSSGKNKLLASVAEKMPFSGGEAIYDSQQKAFNKAVAKSFGVDSDKITGRTIKEGYKVTGDLFDQALEGLSVKVDDPTIIDGLAKLQNETQFVSNDQAKIVNKHIDKFLEQANAQGFVPAEKLGSFRSDLTKAIQRTSGDAKNYLKDLREIVIDASVAGDEGRKNLLNEARMKYKNLKTIEDIATKAQGNSGNISPALLMTPTKKSFSGTMSRGGESDLEELARIGQQFLRQQPSSATAERLQITGQLGLPLAALLNPSTTPMLFAPSLGSIGFNALNRNQTLVKNAVRKAASPKALKSSPLQSVAKASKKAVTP